MSQNEAWTKERFERWYREHPVIPRRDYAKTLLPRIEALGQREGFTVERYGSASYATNNEYGGTDTVTHDLFRILVGDFDANKPTYFIIGGTHGYEKSGPLAALGFAEEEAADYAAKYNIVIYPCLCPGPYEKELRFTEGRIDTNRDALLDEARSQEMQAFGTSVKELHTRMFGDDLTREFSAAIDLHETPKMDIEIDKENAEAGGELFNLDIFPEGFFIVTFEDDQELGYSILRSVETSGHRIVNAPEISGIKNNNGILFIKDLGGITGTVCQLMKKFTAASFTTEFCGENISDGMPDAERNAPQRAAIRSMFLQP